MLVLIVEDNPLVAMNLREMVLENADADVVVSGSLASTRPLLHRPFDFAFFDVDLPDGKTYGIATELLAKNVPFVFVSGSAVRDVPPELRGVPFVPKPFMAADIARAMKRAPALVH